MSGSIRSDIYGKSLKIHNKSNGIMEMDKQGNLLINTKSFNSNINNNLNINYWKSKYFIRKWKFNIKL